MASDAVGSVARILDRVLQHQHFIVENREEVESLFHEVTSLQAILQNSSHNLESEIVQSACETRDLIETHITEQIIRGNNLIFSSYESLDEAKDEICVMAQGLGEIVAAVLKTEKISPWRDLYKHAAENIASNMFVPGGRNAFITGMAGMGKTTIARRVFNGPAHWFKIRAWVTVSQPYNAEQILIDVLHSLGNCREEMHEKTTEELQGYLYTSIKGQRYLIVLDDLSDFQILDYLTQMLPKDSDTVGGILVTTRLENEAVLAKSSDVYLLTIYAQNNHRQSLFRKSRKQAESILNKVSLLHRIILENSTGKTIEETKSLANQIMINVQKRANALTEPCFMEYNLTFSPECLTKAKGKIDMVKTLIEKIDKEGEEQNMHCLSSAPIGNITADDFAEIKNKLIEQSSKLEIVSLVGMVGIGKTTLAKQVYDDKFFIESFPIRAWVTISQSYDREKAITDLLDSMKMESVNVDGKSTAQDLGLRLYQRLKGWKYLIVIDDVWDAKVWDDLRRLFPDEERSSRILLTSRLDDVAKHANSYLHHVHFLDEGKSWNLFCSKVFGENACPPQLEKIGKKIVGNCRGLPLSIVVIGGLLSRITKTQEHWENISHDLSSVMLSSGTDYFLQILSLSYAHLSDHMKKCFLYIGIFPKDSNIYVSRLLKLWIAKGFIKPQCSNELMEDVAYATLRDLIGRSLVLVDKLGSTGKIKTCKIHDLVRDFCTREAKREMLFHITDVSLYGIPVDAQIPVSLSIHRNEQNIIPCDNKKLLRLEVSSLHIFDRNFRYSMDHLNREPLEVLDLESNEFLSRNLRNLSSLHYSMDHLNREPLEALDLESFYLESNECLSHNLRYLSFVHSDPNYELCVPPSSGLPKLQTIILPESHYAGSSKFSNMWNMAQLRHVKMGRLYLSDCVEGEDSTVVLENLQTLSQVYNFRWSKEVLLRIPNLKKLGILYKLEESDWKHYCLENLMYLQKLESLTCDFWKPFPSDLLHILKFPPSLKKLTLNGCGIPWEGLPWKDMKIISRLPNLEVLKLRPGSFAGKEWEWESTDDEEFPKLKHLLLQGLDLELWAADSVNFPCLERLIIWSCLRLKEIPRCIGGLPTLELIELRNYHTSLGDVVKKMQEEEMDLGNERLNLIVRNWELLHDEVVIYRTSS